MPNVPVPSPELQFYGSTLTYRICLSNLLIEFIYPEISLYPQHFIEISSCNPKLKSNDES